MFHIHPYIQADLKYTITNPKCNFRYKNLLTKKKLHSQKGGEIFGSGKYKFDFQENDLGDMKLIFIGNKENCITALIKDDEPNIVDLNGFSYYKSCNFTKDLERKSGSQQMMNTFIKYIKEKYKNVNTIILADNSHIVCSNKAFKDYKKRLPLYNLYLFKYGCSYYEKYFNFTLVDDGVKHNFNLEKYKTITLDKDKIYTFLLTIFDKTNPLIMNDIEKFMNLITDNELAYKFIKHYDYDKVELCYILNEFLDYIMTENKLYKLYGSTYQNKFLEKT
jgi:hypothetical protein